jgi:opacity protein-like surface antigen
MKKNLLLLLGAFVLVSSSLRAQTPAPDTLNGWKNTNLIGLNFTQIALNNWAGGGQNTVAFVGLFQGAYNYHFNNMDWKNTLELGYGVAKLGKADWQKSEDRIIFISDWSKGVSDKSPFRYAALLDFRTQFYIGRNVASTLEPKPVVSRFFSPAYLLTGIGVEYQPVDYFSVSFKPLTGRTIFVLDDALSAIGAFGVDPGSKIKFELGAMMNIVFNKELFKNITFQQRINIFAPYQAFTTMVVLSESRLNLKVNDYVTVGLALDAFYDEKVRVNRDDGTVGPATQFRNTLTVGFNYKF